VPPSTTGDDAADVVAAVLESRRLLNEVLLDPTSDAKAQAASAWFAADALDRVAMLVARYRADGLAEVTNDENPARVVPYAETLVVDEGQASASLEYCFVNSNVTVEVGDEGSERVLDDRVVVNLERDDLRWIDERWKIVDGVILTTYEGASECPEQP
jgi:hypothetical protein